LRLKASDKTLFFDEMYRAVRRKSWQAESQNSERKYCIIKGPYSPLEVPLLTAETTIWNVTAQKETGQCIRQGPAGNKEGKNLVNVNGGVHRGMVGKESGRLGKGEGEICTLKEGAITEGARSISGKTIGRERAGRDQTGLAVKKREKFGVPLQIRAQAASEGNKMGLMAN
jgi:hypothetical protein